MSGESIAFIGVVLIVALEFISYVTPYWIVYGELVSFGLLAHCELDTCGWFLEDNNVQKALPGEFILVVNSDLVC